MPFNFESQKISARNLVLSANKQLSANDIFADASLTERQRFDGSAVMEFVPTRRSDKDMAGKGTEFATEGQLTSFDTKFTMKAEADTWFAGWALAFALGKDTVSGAGPYVHTFAFDETTTQAPMTNLYIEDTAAVKTKYPDMAMSELTLNYASRGSVMIDATMMGTGRFTDGAMVTLPTLNATPLYLLNSDTVFSVGPVGGLVNMTGRFLSGALKISTSVVNHTAPGGGLYGIFMRTGLRKVSFDFVVAAKDTDDVRTLLINDTLSAMTIVTTSGAGIMNIGLPNFKLKAAPLAKDGNMVTWKISGDETSMYNVAGAGVITASVTNAQQTAYLIGV
jgi:hypothetical protein